MSTERYLNEREVSTLTGLALPTLRNYRSTNQGPPYVKVGRAVRYSLSDVYEYMEARKITPGTASDDGEAA
jgi:predicted DNA-binding transcriptional regulator AlpA